MEKIMLQQKINAPKLNVQQMVASRYMDEQIQEINLLNKSKLVIFPCTSKITS